MKKASALYTAAAILAAGAVGCVGVQAAYGSTEQQQIPWSQSIGFHNGAYPVNTLTTTIDVPSLTCSPNLQAGDYQQLYISASNGTSGFAIGWYYDGTDIEEYTWTTTNGGVFYGALKPGAMVTVQITMNVKTGDVTGSFEGIASGATANVGTMGVVGSEDVGEYPASSSPAWTAVGFTDLNYNANMPINSGTVVVYGGKTNTCNSFAID